MTLQQALDGESDGAPSLAPPLFAKVAELTRRGDHFRVVLAPSAGVTMTIEHRSNPGPNGSNVARLHAHTSGRDEGLLEIRTQTTTTYVKASALALVEKMEDLAIVQEVPR